jgi:hypothetical protein
MREFMIRKILSKTTLHTEGWKEDTGGWKEDTDPAGLGLCGDDL